MKGEVRARLFVWFQYALPHHLLSRLTLAATRARTPWFRDLLIRGFLALFPVDMSEAVETDPYRYASFNEFFTRALESGARPIAPGTADLACPVDGRVSECGTLEGDSLLQAKGRHYSVIDLLAGQDWAARFCGGSFATIYLAPFNYHRIHMPARGRLLDTVYVPGRLFSVNAATARRVPRLFARNERVLTLFEGEFGHFAVVLVGALNVGSMATVWAGDITPAARHTAARHTAARHTAARHTAARRTLAHIPAPDTVLEKGAELGRFNMGSTVIVLFPPGAVRWRASLAAGTAVRMGECLGELS